MKLLNTIVLASLCLCLGCKRSFLDIKPSSDIVSPRSLQDFEYLLDNSALNTGPALPTLSADEYEYMDGNAWLSAGSATERNAYIWNVELYGGETQRRDWTDPYTSVFYANSVLDGLAERQDSMVTTGYDYVRGWALFVRANAFYQLLQNFGSPYKESTAAEDLGIPLRLTADVDYIAPRSSVGVCYTQILKDIGTASSLLPAGIPLEHRNRPSKEACFALLARIHLNRREYAKAYAFADNALSLYDKLLDYNNVDKTSTSPFLRTNEEVIFAAQQIPAYAVTATAVSNTRITMDRQLMELYEVDDLRLPLYYSTRADGGVSLKRGYTQGLYGFTGLAVDELFLIRAECLARANRISEAMEDLNRLLVNRYRKGSFVPRNSEDERSALSMILEERRKELVWRGLRWFDIQRLNAEGAGIVLTRQLDGEEYRLEPNDTRYVFPIPDDEMVRSGIEQNIR